MKTFVLHYLFILCLSISPILIFASSIGEITWTNSFLNEEDRIPTDRMKFGYLTVPEDYDKPEGRSLKIAFIIIKAAIDESANDACMFFMGGWGSRTIKNLPYYHNNFLSYRKDLILYDYRGTGYSEPKLCEDIGENVFKNVLANKSYYEFEERQKQLFDNCLDLIEAKGFDINQYGTDNKGKDGVLLAKALGYDSYNLFGVSYGTKTILQFIRQSTVEIRSVIMDSNCPLDFPINSGMTEDYANSLNHILDDCANDPKCNKKYPNLKEDLTIFLQSLDEKQLKVGIAGGRQAYLNKQEVNGILHQMLYDEWSYGSIPFLLKKFSKRNKFIIKRILNNLEAVLLDNYNGVGLINYVYDHRPFQEMAREISHKSISHYPDLEVFDGYKAYYLQDERFLSNELSTHMLKTDIPTLILAGGYDPITPVYYSKRLLPYFSNHYYVEFPYTGHGVTNNRCGRAIAENFLNTLESPYDNSCIEEIKGQKIWFNR